MRLDLQLCQMEAIHKQTIQTGQCAFCGQSAADYNLELNQNTGAIIVRYRKCYKGKMCRACAKKTFAKTQVHNLFLGWWGTISFFVTPFYLLANTISYISFLFVANKEDL